MCLWKIRLICRFVRKPVLRYNSLPELTRPLGTIECFEWRAIGSVWNITYKPNLMITRLTQLTDISRQVGDHGSTGDFATIIDVGHHMHKEVIVHNLDTQPLVLQGLDVRIKNDLFW